jgi:hypothetical protein
MVVAGIYYISYGAVYNGTYFLQGGFGGCRVGCTSSSFSDASIRLVEYPLWSPPIWNHVNYSAPLCNPTPNATYTPQSPPPSCLYPPADFSADYTRSYGGVALVLIGSAASIVAAKGGEPKADLPDSTTDFRD